MTEETNPIPQAQAVPTPEVVQAPQPEQLQYVPAIQGVQFYFSLGQSANGIQMYSFDINLKQWRIAQEKEVESIMTSLGVPANVLAAMKNLRF